MTNGIFHRLVHFSISLLKALRFEHGVPSKVSRPSSRDNTTRSTTNKHQGVIFRTRCIGKSTLSIGGLILKAYEHFIKTLVANFLQKPFNIRAREAVEGVEAKAGVFNHHCTANLESGKAAFFPSDVFWLALEFWEVEFDGVDGEGESFTMG